MEWGFFFSINRCKGGFATLLSIISLCERPFAVRAALSIISCVATALVKTYNFFFDYYTGKTYHFSCKYCTKSCKGISYIVWLRHW